MSGKSLITAKQTRDKLLLEFKASVYDLEEELSASGSSRNIRRIKLKKKETETSYKDCLEAQSKVYGLENSSGGEENNWNWVLTNLKKPYNEIMRRADTLLEEVEPLVDPEAEKKTQIVASRKKVQRDLLYLEAKLKAGVDGAMKAYGDTTIWLVSNHEALTGEVDQLARDLDEKHLTLSQRYLDYLEADDENKEYERAETFRGEMLPKIAELRAGLKGKAPKQISEASTVAMPSVESGRVEAAAGGITHPSAYKAKFKMAAMAVPKFSGKVVDYPEWKTLFKDCVEAQYEESAVIMILRTEALPDSLTCMVPRCATLNSVWEKLDKKFLDPARVWKGIKSDLASLDRKKLGNCKYIVELVSKLLDAESLLD